MDSYYRDRFESSYSEDLSVFQYEQGMVIVDLEVGITTDNSLTNFSRDDFMLLTYFLKAIILQTNAAFTVSCAYPTNIHCLQVDVSYPQVAGG